MPVDSKIISCLYKCKIGDKIVFSWVEGAKEEDDLTAEVFSMDYLFNYELKLPRVKVKLYSRFDKVYPIFVNNYYPHSYFVKKIIKKCPY